MMMPIGIGSIVQNSIICPFVDSPVTDSKRSNMIHHRLQANLPTEKLSSFVLRIEYKYASSSVSYRWIYKRIGRESRCVVNCKRWVICYITYKLESLQHSEKQVIVLFMARCFTWVWLGLVNFWNKQKGL